MTSNYFIAVGENPTVFILDKEKRNSPSEFLMYKNFLNNNISYNNKNNLKNKNYTD